MSWLRTYTLNKDRLAVPCFDMLAWGRWMDQADRRVARDAIDGYVVSTIFLGLDHNHRRGLWHDPLLFETMTFDGRESLNMDRYPTWAEALAGHERLCQMLRHELAQANRVTLDLLRGMLHAPATTEGNP